MPVANTGAGDGELNLNVDDQAGEPLVGRTSNGRSADSSQ